MKENETRRCSKCGVDKPLSGFHVDRQKASGHRPDCKACVTKRGRDSYAARKGDAR